MLGDFVIRHPSEGISPLQTAIKQKHGRWMKATFTRTTEEKHTKIVDDERKALRKLIIFICCLFIVGRWHLHQFYARSLLCHIASQLLQAQPKAHTRKLRNPIRLSCIVNLAKNKWSESILILCHRFMAQLLKPGIDIAIFVTNQPAGQKQQMYSRRNKMRQKVEFHLLCR